MKEYPVDFQLAFEALPGSFMLLKPNPPHFSILAISEELLHLLAQQRPQVLGKGVGEVYPAASLAPAASALHGSLQRALRNKQPAQAPVSRVDVACSNGTTTMYYWSGTTKPVLAPTGEVLYLLHQVHDVTQQLAADARQPGAAHSTGLLQQAPVALCLLTGPEHTVEFVNEEMQQLLGPAAELVGRPLAASLTDTAGNTLLKALDQVRATGQLREIPKYPIPSLLNSLQKQHYYHFVFKPYPAAPHAATGILGVAYDVTELVHRRQQSEEGYEELHQFKLMADQARDPFVLMRADGSFAYLNQKALEAWGYTEEEAQSLRVPDIDPIYQEQEFTQLFAKAQHETLPAFKTLHRHKNGTVFPVEVNLTGFLLSGQPYLFAIPRDITQQQSFMQALRESEERFRIMADAAPNLVWAVHPDSSIRYVNQAFLEFVGLSLEEYLAVGWSPYMRPQELKTAQQALTQAILTRSVYTLEHRMRRHDGQERWLLAQGAPSYFPNGDLYGYVGSAIDITELKLANEQLVQINNDLDNFVYTASHDLKAPISNIEGLLHALVRTLPPEIMQSERVLRLTELMQESVERFTKTIANLTDIVKLQKENNGEAVEVNLAEVIRNVCLDLEPLRQTVGAEIIADVADCPAIRFSEKNLRSVAYNLVSNALKYSAPERPPRVALQCTTTPEYHVLQVTDNGLGIETERQSQLFSMFKRFHDHVDGSGLGLYMVKKIVENAGGKIEVESQPGVGSTFRVYFRR